jgi:hypothetical protein
MNRTLGRILPAGMLCAGLLLAGLPALADPLPTPHQVAQAVHDGRLAQAQGMVEKVLAARPDSAEAHFLEAEIFVRQGRADAAEQELAAAERLKPGLPFTHPDNVRNLRLMIAERSVRDGARAAHAGETQSESSFPWGVLLIVLGAGAVLYLFLRNRAQQVQVVTGPGGVGPAGAYGAPYGGGPMMGGGGIGSGIMGGLATGAALGAGMVAGEALAHNLMGDRRDSSGGVVADNGPAVRDDSGQDFGLSDSGNWDGGGIADSGGDMGGGGGDWG